MANKNTEDYLKAIYAISADGGEASTNEIARHFGIAASSVTEMLKKLAEKGYVKYSPYQGASLTPMGREKAENVVRKHRLLERFLHDVLKMKGDKVHAQACEMEHALSDEAEESMCRLLQHPGTCPDDGKVIPACNLPFSSCEECVRTHRMGLEEAGKRKQNLTPVNCLKKGSRGRVSFIRGERKTLQRLLDMGLTPGTPIKVERVAPLNGPVEISVRGSMVALGQDIASNVFVESE